MFADRSPELHGRFGAFRPVDSYRGCLQRVRRQIEIIHQQTGPSRAQADFLGTIDYGMEFGRYRRLYSGAA